MKSHKSEDEESMCFGNCSEFVSQLLFVILGKLSSASGFFFYLDRYFYFLKVFSITVDIQYVSFRCTAQWLDIYI